MDGTILGSGDVSARDGRCCTTIVISNQNCPTAFLSPGPLKLDKCIKTEKGCQKKISTCVVEGDELDVTYRFRATQEQTGEVCFVWPVTISNNGKARTEGLKVGTKVYYRCQRKDFEDRLLEGAGDLDEDLESGADESAKRGRSRSRSRCKKCKKSCSPCGCRIEKSKSKSRSRSRSKCGRCGKGRSRSPCGCSREEGWHFAGTFDGAERDKPCLGPGESHRYIISGCFKPKECRNRKIEIKLVTDGVLVIRNYGHTARCHTDGPHETVTTCVSNNKLKEEELFLVDRRLGIDEKIKFEHREFCLEKCVLLKPCKDGKCSECIVNHASIQKARCGECVTKDKCNHRDDHTKGCAQAEAELEVKCARVKLRCDLKHGQCHSDWCLSKSSSRRELCGDELKLTYIIDAKKLQVTNPEACLSAVVELEGCTPCYDKEFKLELFQGDRRLDKVTFTLGGPCGANKFFYPSGKLAGASHGTQAAFIELKDEHSGNFTFVLSYSPETVHLKDFTTSPIPDCHRKEHREIKTCRPGFGNASATITDRLCVVPHKDNYRIADSGSFESESDLRKFLNGCPVKIHGSKRIEFALLFKKECTVVTNTATLRSKQEGREIKIEAHVTDDLRHRERSRSRSRSKPRSCSRPRKSRSRSCSPSRKSRSRDRTRSRGRSPVCRRDRDRSRCDSPPTIPCPPVCKKRQSCSKSRSCERGSSVGTRHRSRSVGRPSSRIGDRSGRRRSRSRSESPVRPLPLRQDRDTASSRPASTLLRVGVVYPGTPPAKSPNPTPYRPSRPKK